MKHKSFFFGFVYTLLILSILFSFVLLLGDLLVVNQNLPPKLDLIIALGYKLNPDGHSNDVIRYRVEKAVELYKMGISKKILFSGGKGNSNISEAEFMANMAEDFGVPKESIFQENFSNNTIENLENSIKVMKLNNWHSAVIVTSPYHTMRTKMLLSKYDGSFYIIESQRTTDLSIVERVYDICYELFVLISYRFN